ncbi:hypothetical protein K1719_015899 [Acacia pycnantha]|nr:hypothetical protein K1719_015899 [Acacia pycnantha]
MHAWPISTCSATPRSIHSINTAGTYNSAVTTDHSKFSSPTPSTKVKRKESGLGPCWWYYVWKLVTLLCCVHAWPWVSGHSLTHSLTLDTYHKQDDFSCCCWQKVKSSCMLVSIDYLSAFPVSYFSRKLADKIAAPGYYVVVPNFLHGDPFVPEKADRPISVWIKDHPQNVNQILLLGSASVGTASGFCVKHFVV